VSALTGFKKRQYDAGADDEDDGAENFQAKSDGIDVNLPLCPKEMDGKECDDELCPGQHWDDFDG
jgi:hypothetical protein